MPTDEIGDARRHRADAVRVERGMTRRQALQTAGAAALGLAAASSLPACDDERPGEQVVIVGAGIAGLHCAYRLKKLGIRAHVFDAQKRAGGRMFTDRTTFANGQHCELGGELIDTGHLTMLGLAEELGIELYDYLDDAPLRPLTAFIDGNLLSDIQILDEFSALTDSIDAALATFANPDKIPSYADANGAASLDQLSIAAWLDSIGASGAVRKLLEVAYTTEYGLPIDQSNALNFLILISTNLDRFEIFGASDERFHTKTGNDTFITELQKRLAGQISVQSALVAIKPRSAGGYFLTFFKDDRYVEVRADHVVLAIPFTMLRMVDLSALPLKPQKKRAIAELGYGTNAKLMTGYTSRPWRTLGFNGESFSTLPYQCTWDTSRLQPGASGILTNFTGGAQGLAVGMGTPAMQAATFLDQIDQVYAGTKVAHDGKVVRMHWPTNGWVKGSYASYLVGQYTAFSGAEGEKGGPGLYFCGEHTSLVAQGYMEGGAETGARAAEEVGAALGLRPPLTEAVRAGLTIPPWKLRRMLRRPGPLAVRLTQPPTRR